MIIAFCGLIESGKDTCGILLDELWSEKNYKGSKTTGRMNAVFYDSFQHIKFTDGVNKTIATFTGLPLEYVNNKENYNKPIKWLGGLTLRDVKNKLGEGFKPLFGENIWAKIAFTKVSPNANVRITDLRFRVELNFLLPMKPIIIELIRPEHKSDASEENKKAVSEQYHINIPSEFITHSIINDGSRLDLKNKLRVALETHEEWKNPISLQRSF